VLANKSVDERSP